MVGSISTKEIDVLVNNLDRPQLLTILRVEDMTGQVGDDECVHPIAVSTVERFTVHKNMCLCCEKLTSINAPEQSCFGKSPLDIPCFSQDVESNGFCEVCNET